MTAGAWLALAALYIAFAGQASAAEAVAAVGAATIAAALPLAGQDRQRRFSLRAPWHRILPRLAWATVRDVARLVPVLAMAVVLRRSGGGVLLQPLRPASADARERGRRALAVLFASFAPNAYVTECRRDCLVLHRLAPASPSGDREWAG